MTRNKSIRPERSNSIKNSVSGVFEAGTAKVEEGDPSEKKV